LENGVRHYHFMHSMIEAALISGRELLSRTLIQAINFHAIACLHAGAGHFRSCAVTVGAYDPPGPERVESMMDDFINMTNLNSKESQVIPLASSVLWAINHIHPFVNGNGRTARAIAYFAICVKLGKLLPGQPILPELLRENRPRYVEALREADGTGGRDRSSLEDLLEKLLIQQLSSQQ